MRADLFRLIYLCHNGAAWCKYDLVHTLLHYTFFCSLETCVHRSFFASGLVKDLSVTRWVAGIPSSHVAIGHKWRVLSCLSTGLRCEARRVVIPPESRYPVTRTLPSTLNVASVSSIKGDLNAVRKYCPRNQHQCATIGRLGLWGTACWMEKWAGPGSCDWLLGMAVSCSGI